MMTFTLKSTSMPSSDVGSQDQKCVDVTQHCQGSKKITALAV